MVKRYININRDKSISFKGGKFKMTIPAGVMDRSFLPCTTSEKAEKQNNTSQTIMSVRQIEIALGFNKVKPIVLTESDKQDTIEKGDYFEDWYEEELRRFYEECNR